MQWLCERSRVALQCGAVLTLGWIDWMALSTPAAAVLDSSARPSALSAICHSTGRILLTMATRHDDDDMHMSEADGHAQLQQQQQQPTDGDEMDDPADHRDPTPADSTSAAASSAAAVEEEDVDLTASAASPVVPDRLLYDVYFHAPHFQPDDRLGGDDPLPLLDSGGAAMDDVSEVEYLAQEERRGAALINSSGVRAARQQMHRVWNCCNRKRAQALREEEARAERAIGAAADEPADAHSDATNGAGDSATSGDSSAVHGNWPLLLSPNGDLLAIVKERSLLIRGSNHDFAFQQLEFPLPPYAHLASPYPRSLTQLAQLALPAAAADSATIGRAHPFSQSHARPCAWSMRSELIAVVVRQDEVAVYSLSPLRLVHTLSVAAPSPLGAAAAASASSLTLPIQSRRRARFPSIAALVFREAVCPHTPRGYCPHLLVLCCDGSVHHLHIPAVAMHADAGPTVPPSPSPFLPDSHAVAPSPPPAAFYPPHLPLAHSSRSGAATDTAVDSTMPRADEQQLRRRGTVSKASTADTDSSKSLESSDETKAEPATAGSREYLSFLDATAVHAGNAGNGAVSFGSAHYDATHELLYLASVSLSRDRAPLVSLWRVSDTEAPFLFPVACTPRAPALAPAPKPRPNRAFTRLVSYVKMSIGMGDIGQAGDDAVGEAEYTPSLADVACSLRVSADGARIALLDMRGNLNVWLCDLDAAPISCALLDSHRAQDGCPSVAGGGSDSFSAVAAARSSALLCDVSWWSSELLLCAYTNGHLILTPVNSPSMLSARSTSRSSGDVPSPAFSAPSMHQLHLCSGDSLRRNLLGDQAEGVHGIPTLSRAMEARRSPQRAAMASPLFGSSSQPRSSPSLSPGFTLPHRVFLLECERRFLRRRKVWSSVGAHDSESGVGIGGGGGGDAVDSDGTPPIQLRRTFRLLSLCQSTPEEFLFAKLEARQYDEALSLARAYNLNTDLIYQSRWRCSPVTPHSVRAFLLPVQDQWWVLQQLVERLFDVQEDTGAATLLLQCGLDLTTPEHIAERRKATMAASQLARHTDGADGGSADQQQMEPHLLAALERDQTKLCMYRLLFLHYDDRVRTLSAIEALAPPSVSLSLGRLSLSSFLDCDLVEAGLALAADEQFDALQLLFYHHQEELWLARGEILAAIPDCTDPALYASRMPLPGMAFDQFAQSVLQQMEEQEQAQLHDNQSPLDEDGANRDDEDGVDAVADTSASLPPRLWERRDRDWVENVELLDTMLHLSQQQEAAARSSPTATPFASPFSLSALEAKLQWLRLQEAGELELTAAEVRQWYTQRIVDIDARSGQLNYAAKLLEHAQRVLEVEGLDEEARTLDDLCLLVYTHGLETLSLREYAPLDDFARLCLVLRAATPNSIVQDLHTKARIFFQRSLASEAAPPVDPEDPFVLSPHTPPLLRRYMLHIAPTRLDLVYAIILASKPGSSGGATSDSPSSAPASASSLASPSSQRLLADHADLVSVSVECCYYSSADEKGPTDAETVQLLTHIFECLPARSHSDSPRLSRLHRYLDELDSHLTAVEIMHKYGPAQGRPLWWFLTLPPHDADAQQLQRWGPARAALEQRQATELQWARKHPSLKLKSSPPARVETQCMQLLESMARGCMKQRSPPLSDEGWRGLLRDLLELRLKVFPFIAPQQIHSLVLHCTLAKERWVLSRSMLRTLTSEPVDGQGAPLMPLGDAERLVLDVARELLDSAPGLRHPSLAQARACLDILPIHSADDAHDDESSGRGRGRSPAAASLNQLSSSPLTAEWQGEFELISGLQRLEKLGITHLVPLEIRLAKNRQQAVAGAQPPAASQAPLLEATAPPVSHPTVLDLMLRSNPRVYTHGAEVLEVLRSFGWASEQLQVAAQLRLAEAALHDADYRASIKMLLSLMEHAPPANGLQREQAAQLCYQLSQHLHYGAAATAANQTSPGGVLLKPKLHLLAHSMWACAEPQQLEQYLREYEELSNKQMALEQQNQSSQAPSQADESDDSGSGSGSDSIDNDDDVDADAHGNHRASPPAQSLLDEDGEAPSEMERLVAAAFDGAPARSASTTSPLQSHRLGLLSSSGAGDVRSAEAAGALDDALLPLIGRTCGVDSAVALSYLLSLSNPLAAQSVLDARISESGDASAADEQQHHLQLPTLSRAQRQDTVELAVRFFAIVCLLQPHSARVLAAIRRHLAAAAAQPDTPTASTGRGALPPPTLTEWVVPPISTLLDCSPDLLQSYLEPLNAAYDALAAAGDTVTTTDGAVAVEGSDLKPTALTLALHYNSIRLESKKSEFILLHCPNLDIVRFTTDAAYRVDSVMQLARGDGASDADGEENKFASASASRSPPSGGDESGALSSAKMLEIALVLCKRYHLPPLDVYLERTKALFERTRTLSALRTAIAPFKTDHLLLHPIPTYTYLIRAVWPCISGSDLPRLALLMELCLECFAAVLQSYSSAASSFTSPAKKKSLVLYERNLQRLQEHKELLDKLHAIQQANASAAGGAGTGAAVAVAVAASGGSGLLDYKLLLSSPSSCMCELRKLLTEHNIFLVSRLCSKIQHLLRCGQADAADAAATAVEPNRGLFPVLKTDGLVACNNLADVFWDLPPTADSPPPPMDDTDGHADADDSLSIAASTAVRIDSSLIFQLFLASSLRKHMDLLVAFGNAANGAAAPAAAASAAAAMPTVTAWFAHYDKLLKRLSVAHLVQLVLDITLSGVHTHSSQPVADGFMVRPSRSELRCRLEVAQCGMRVLELLPAWQGVAAASSASSNSAASTSGASLQRSLSHDLDLSGGPQLSAESRSLYHDRLADVHSYLCILCAIFDLQCIHATDLWSALVRSQGRAPDLHALMRMALLEVPRSSLKPNDCKRMLDKIRVQKESVEFRSKRYQDKAEEEERAYQWDLFALLRLCVDQQLRPDHYFFTVDLSTEDSCTLSLLTDTRALVQVSSSTSSKPVDLTDLLLSFSLSLGEERNIELFQLLLQFLTSPPETHESGMGARAQVEYVRTQLHVLLLLTDLAGRSASAPSGSISQPLHSSLQDQLNGSAALRTMLQRSLHVHLLLAGCVDAATTVPAASLSKLAARMESVRTRSAAVQEAFALLLDQPETGMASAALHRHRVCASLAAILIVLHSEDYNQQTGENDSRRVSAVHAPCFVLFFVPARMWPLLTLTVDCMCAYLCVQSGRLYCLGCAATANGRCCCH